MGDDKKKPVGMLGASIPTAGGWENMPVGERIRQTFERGITRAELDLADAFGKGIRPGAIPEIQKKRTQEIAREFSGQLSVHAPYQVEFSSPSIFQQAEAAEILKQSVKYAKDLGAKIITIHPTAVMGAGFRDPFTGQLQTVPPYLLCKDDAEFKEWADTHGIKEHTTQYEHLNAMRENFFRAQSTVYAQQQAAAKPIFMRDYANAYANWNLPYEYLQMKKRGLSDRDIKLEIQTKLINLEQTAEPEIKQVAESVHNEFKKNSEDFLKKLESRTLLEDPQTGQLLSKEASEERLKKISDHYWQQATVCVGGRLNRDGTWANPQKPGDKEDPKVKNFMDALAMERVIDLKGEEQHVIENLKETFDNAFKDEGFVKMMKEGKITLALENLYGINGDTGWLNGFAYYTRPEHMEKAINAIREVAEKHGVSGDQIGFTFDTEHAAINYNQTPTEFIDKMKAKGIKITNAHLVGGSPATGVGIFGHKGFGSWEDEIMRKNPELLKKIQESGAPITIEPGSGGIKDIEDAMQTLQTGAPMEALMAAESSDALHKLGYAAVENNAGYFQQAADMYSAMVNKGGFYSFGPSVQQPFKSSFGSFASPSLYGGGILHRDTPTNIWGSSQPLLYSTKTGEEEGH